MALTNLLFTALAWSEKSELLFAIAVIFDEVVEHHFYQMTCVFTSNNKVLRLVWKLLILIGHKVPAELGVTIYK